MTFLRKEPKHQFILNGWRYRIAIKLSSEARAYFGPAVGYGRLIKVGADDAALDFEKIEAAAAKYVQGSYPVRPMKPLAAYCKALEDAEHELFWTRTELNRVISEMIVNRRLPKKLAIWDAMDRAAGFNVVSIRRGFGVDHILSEAAE